MYLRSPTRNSTQHLVTRILANNPQSLPQFDTDQTLWYDNGIWGSAGYGMVNPMGKTLTSNLDTFQMRIHRRQKLLPTG